MSDNLKRKEIPVIGERIRRLWNISAIIWTVVYYAVNILAFCASIFVILIESFFEENETIVILLSATSAVLAFVGFAINFKQQFPRYRRAFNILNAAMLDYYAHPQDPTKIDAIVKAISDGEDYIDNSYDINNSGKTVTESKNCVCRKEVDGVSVD